MDEPQISNFPKKPDWAIWIQMQEKKLQYKKKTLKEFTWAIPHKSVKPITNEQQCLKAKPNSSSESKNATGRESKKENF